VPFRRRFEFPPYVSAAERHLLRQRVAARFAARAGALSPVVIEGHKIAHTFWGKAWCDNLERYSDFANRLPRGRSYVRSGAVIDLRVEPGHVVARVAGSDVYEVEVSVAAMPAAQWKALCRDCAGAIDSVVALLQGALPGDVIARLYERERGLFPSPRQITLRCSCPDRASISGRSCSSCCAAWIKRSWWPGRVSTSNAAPGRRHRTACSRPPISPSSSASRSRRPRLLDAEHPQHRVDVAFVRRDEGHIVRGHALRHESHRA
jgi:hypothetical protein